MSTGERWRALIVLAVALVAVGCLHAFRVWWAPTPPPAPPATCTQPTCYPSEGI